MTRKDYVRIAGAIHASRTRPEQHCASIREQTSTLRRVAGNIADTLAADNPRFDRARFLAACGVTA